jgi:hypothetical protein
MELATGIGPVTCRLQAQKRQNPFFSPTSKKPLVKTVLNYFLPAKGE